MELTHGFGKMEDLAGPCKKDSGTGPQKRHFSKKEKVALTAVIVNIGLILFFMSCIASLMKWYDKVRYKAKNKFNSYKKVDIIEAQYEEVNEQEKT